MTLKADIDEGCKIACWMDNGKGKLYYDTGTELGLRVETRDISLTPMPYDTVNGYYLVRIMSDSAKIDHLTINDEEVTLGDTILKVIPFAGLRFKGASKVQGYKAVIYSPEDVNNMIYTLSDSTEVKFTISTIIATISVSVTADTTVAKSFTRLDSTPAPPPPTPIWHEPLGQNQTLYTATPGSRAQFLTPLAGEAYRWRSRQTEFDVTAGGEIAYTVTKKQDTLYLTNAGVGIVEVLTQTDSTLGDVLGDGWHYVGDTIRLTPSAGERHVYIDFEPDDIDSVSGWGCYKYGETAWLQAFPRVGKVVEEWIDTRTNTIIGYGPKFLYKVQNSNELAVRTSEDPTGTLFIYVGNSIPGEDGKPDTGLDFITIDDKTIVSAGDTGMFTFTYLKQHPYRIRVGTHSTDPHLKHEWAWHGFYRSDGSLWNQKQDFETVFLGDETILLPLVEQLHFGRVYVCMYDTVPPNYKKNRNALKEWRKKVFDQTQVTAFVDDADPPVAWVQTGGMSDTHPYVELPEWIMDKYPWDKLRVTVSKFDNPGPLEMWYDMERKQSFKPEIKRWTPEPAVFTTHFADATMVQHLFVAPRNLGWTFWDDLTWCMEIFAMTFGAMAFGFDAAAMWLEAEAAEIAAEGLELEDLGEALFEELENPDYEEAEEAGLLGNAAVNFEVGPTGEWEMELEDIPELAGQGGNKVIFRTVEEYNALYGPEGAPKILGEGQWLNMDPAAEEYVNDVQFWRDANFPDDDELPDMIDGLSLNQQYCGGQLDFIGHPEWIRQVVPPDGWYVDEVFPVDPVERDMQIASILKAVSHRILVPLSIVLPLSDWLIRMGVAAKYASLPIDYRVISYDSLDYQVAILEAGWMMTDPFKPRVGKMQIQPTAQEQDMALAERPDVYNLHRSPAMKELWRRLAMYAQRPYMLSKDGGIWRYTEDGALYELKKPTPTDGTKYGRTGRGGHRNQSLQEVTFAAVKDTTADDEANDIWRHVRQLQYAPDTVNTHTYTWYKGDKVIATTTGDEPLRYVVTADETTPIRVHQNPLKHNLRVYIMDNPMATGPFLPIYRLDMADATLCILDTMIYAGDPTCIAPVDQWPETIRSFWVEENPQWDGWGIQPLQASDLRSVRTPSDVLVEDYSKMPDENTVWVFKFRNCDVRELHIWLSSNELYGNGWPADSTVERKFNAWNSRGTPCFYSICYADVSVEPDGTATEPYYAFGESVIRIDFDPYWFNEKAQPDDPVNDFLGWWTYPYRYEQMHLLRDNSQWKMLTRQPATDIRASRYLGKIQNPTTIMGFAGDATGCEITVDNIPPGATVEGLGFHTPFEDVKLNFFGADIMPQSFKLMRLGPDDPQKPMPERLASRNMVGNIFRVPQGKMRFRADWEPRQWRRTLNIDQQTACAVEQLYINGGYYAPQHCVPCGFEWTQPSFDSTRLKLYIPLPPDMGNRVRSESAVYDTVTGEKLCQWVGYFNGGDFQYATIPPKTPLRFGEKHYALQTRITFSNVLQVTGDNMHHVSGCGIAGGGTSADAYAGDKFHIWSNYHTGWGLDYWTANGIRIDGAGTSFDYVMPDSAVTLEAHTLQLCQISGEMGCAQGNAWVEGGGSFKPNDVVTLRINMGTALICPEGLKWYIDPTGNPKDYIDTGCGDFEITFKVSDYTSRTGNTGTLKLHVDCQEGIWPWPCP